MTTKNEQNRELSPEELKKAQGGSILRSPVDPLREVRSSASDIRQDADLLTDQDLDLARGAGMDADQLQRHGESEDKLQKRFKQDDAVDVQ